VQAFQFLSEEGALDGTRGAFKFRSMILPDIYIEHDKQDVMMAKAGLDARAIVAKALEALGDERGAARAMIA
jgi:1-deoxy-D-xylulose-5-phosphate synthase